MPTRYRRLTAISSRLATPAFSLFQEGAFNWHRARFVSRIVCPPMKILHVSYAYPPFFEFGGPPAAVRSLAEHLARRKHHVSVVTSNRGRRTRSISDSAGIDVTYLACLTRYRSSFTINPGIFRFVERQLHGFDVVHIYGTNDFLGWVVGSRCRARGIPYVVEPLGMYQDWTRSRRKKRIYRRFVARPLLDGAAAIVATSALERDELVAEGIPAGKIVVRRNGIDLEEFRPLPRAGQFRQSVQLGETELLTLFLGRLNPVKRIDVLIDAFAATPRPRGKLVVVGPDEDGYLRSLLTKVRSMGLAQEVLFTGGLYGPDRISAFVDADIVVLPSERESFGTSAAEAIAAATPVIITTRCGIAPYFAERNGKGGGIVVDMGVDALTSALQRVLHDDEQRGRLTREATARKEEFSWDSPVRQMEDLYARVLVGR